MGDERGKPRRLLSSYPCLTPCRFFPSRRFDPQTVRGKVGPETSHGLRAKENPALHKTVRDGNLVPGVRLELTRFYPADFESAASTIPPPGETSRKEEVEVYQFRAKKAMDCEGSLRRTAAIHSPSVRPSSAKSSPVSSASGTRTKRRPVMRGCGRMSSGSSLFRSS